jgi:hypothetical protein
LPIGAVNFPCQREHGHADKYCLTCEGVLFTKSQSWIQIERAQWELFSAIYRAVKVAAA